MDDSFENLQNRSLVSGRLYFHLERCHYDENTLYSNFASQ
jgi:hypothetical protein